MPLQQGKPKSTLQIILENTEWKEVYNEHYAIDKIEEELPKSKEGKELQKHFFKNSNKRWLKWRLNQL